MSATLALLPNASFLRRHLWSQSGEQSAGPYWITGPHPLSLALAFAAEESAYPGEPPELAEAERAAAAAKGGGAAAVAEAAAAAAAAARAARADAAAATAAIPHSWVYPSAQVDQAESAASLARDTVMFGHSRNRETQPRAPASSRL